MLLGGVKICVCICLHKDIYIYIYTHVHAYIDANMRRFMCIDWDNAKDHKFFLRWSTLHSNGPRPRAVEQRPAAPAEAHATGQSTAGLLLRSVK